MLATQQFLAQYKDHSMALAMLNSDLAIRGALSETDPLVILNYDTIESRPKNHPIIRECRGLTLEVGTWRVVARSFPRFFNYGEYAEEDQAFDWSDFSCYSKEDGSLAVLYWYRDSWRVNTRGSFALGNVCPGVEMTWEELFYNAGIDEVAIDHLSREYSYVFELCSVYNKIVRTYKTPTLFLLSIFKNDSGKELRPQAVDEIAVFLRVNRPERFNFKSLAEIQAWLATLEDPTQEGVVICDQAGRRMKLKSEKYVALHHLRGEGDNLFHPKYLLPFVLKNDGEDGELIAYFPEVKASLAQVREKVTTARDKMLDVWARTKNIESQKDFANAIVGQTEFASILFQARKMNVGPVHIWNKSSDLILKRLFKGDNNAVAA